MGAQNTSVKKAACKIFTKLQPYRQVKNHFTSIA
jgi:hypothetical protein